MNALASIGQLPGLDWGLVLTYLRIQALVIMLPGYGERILPLWVRVAIAMALTPLMAGLVPPLTLPDTPFALIQGAVPELALGLIMGTLVRVIAWALDIAASALAASASLSQIVGGANEAAPHPIGNFLHLAGLAVVFALGFPMFLIDLIVDGIALWPVGALPSAADWMGDLVALLARSFVLAMVLASPFILGGFLFQALSGVINKVMPSLPVVFIGAPGSILLALAALAVLTPLMISLWADAILSFTLPRPR